AGTCGADKECRIGIPKRVLGNLTRVHVVVLNLENLRIGINVNQFHQQDGKHNGLYVEKQLHDIAARIDHAERYKDRNVDYVANYFWIDGLVYEAKNEVQEQNKHQQYSPWQHVRPEVDCDKQHRQPGNHRFRQRYIDLRKLMQVAVFDRQRRVEENRRN